MSIKRKKKLTYKQFCSVFNKRTFTKMNKINSAICLIELEDGSIQIHERNRIPIIIISPILIMLSFVASLFWFGFKDFKEILGSHLSISPTFRVDDCRPTQETTKKLLEIAGWAK